MKAITYQSPAVRRQKLAAIHVAKSQLQLDDGTYRDLIERVSALVSGDGQGVRSAADLTLRQANAVLDEMRRLGAPMKKLASKRGQVRPGSFPGRPDNADSSAMRTEILKIEALLADLKLSWAYADAIAKRMFKIERVAWCRRHEQLVGIIAALHAEQEKRELLASIGDWCTENGTTLDALEAKHTLREGWRRNRRTLKAIWQQLIA